MITKLNEKKQSPIPGRFNIFKGVSMSLKEALGTKLIRFEPMTKMMFDFKIKGVENVSTDQAIPGYHVQYDNPDGAVYDSWSPKDVFEAAYRDVEHGLDFGGALFFLKRGKGVRLPSWQPDVVIRAKYPDEHSKMTAPYLYVESRFGKVPWKETMIELFSDKWVVVE